MGKIIIAGDCVPTKSNYEYFIHGNLEQLIGKEITELFKSSNFTIVNLEVPLCDSESPIAKCGPNLIASTKTMAGLKELGVSLFTLANNHIMDQGVQGLESTIRTLEKVNISTVGAGKNLADASKPFIFEFANRKIGVYACAEHEFSIATEKQPGANPFDPLWSLDHVAELKDSVDYVIVLYHGGKEHYRYPSPGLQKVCHRLIDKGANLVVCQHSHCIGCEEKYKEGTIVYGQGNFLFDHSKEGCWQTGLLVQLDENLLVSYLPIVKMKNSVKIADKEKAYEILVEFNERSDEIQKSDFIEKRYTQFAKSVLPSYLKVLRGTSSSIVFRVFNKITKGMLATIYLKLIYRKKDLIAIENYVECEAHRELLSKGLESAYKVL